jgi:hypothetical protein
LIGNAPSVNDRIEAFWPIGLPMKDHHVWRH